MGEKEQQEKQLTIREKMAIHVIILLLKVIKPFGWSHEFDEQLKEVYDCMKKGA